MASMDIVKPSFTIQNITHTVLEIPESECTKYKKLPLWSLIYLSYTVYGTIGYLSETVGGYPSRLLYYWDQAPIFLRFQWSTSQLCLIFLRSLILSLVAPRLMFKLVVIESARHPPHWRFHGSRSVLHYDGRRGISVRRLLYTSVFKGKQGRVAQYTVYVHAAHC